MYMFVDAEWIKRQFRMKLKSRSCWQTMQEPVAVAAGVSPLHYLHFISGKNQYFCPSSCLICRMTSHICQRLVSGFGCINRQDGKSWSTAKGSLAQKIETSCYLRLLNSHNTTTATTVFLTKT